MERRGYTSTTSAVSRYAVASSPTALPNGMAEPETLKQALSMLRLLTAQLHEARGDKSVIWEQTRADARAMAQVARNIEGNQGVVSSAIQSLEQQLDATRQEKERERETARGDKKLFERLQREQAPHAMRCCMPCCICATCVLREAEETAHPLTPPHTTLAPPSTP